MTAQTLVTIPDDRELLRFVWMVKRRPVTVLARNDPVQVFSANINDIVMALATVLMHFLFACITVLERLVLPDFLVVFVVEAVHEAILT